VNNVVHIRIVAGVWRLKDFTRAWAGKTAHLSDYWIDG